MPVTERQQSPKEEIANSITHGIGAGLAVAALVLLLVSAAQCLFTLANSVLSTAAYLGMGLLARDGGLGLAGLAGDGPAGRPAAPGVRDRGLPPCRPRPELTP